MVAPQISAIICTYNRDAYLGGAIDSLLAQEFSGEFEVIVVDNASTDTTRQVVEARQPNSRLRYVCEPTAGLSLARNRGASVARAPILAYLDDDAVASPGWLRSLHRAYETIDTLAIAGGKVTLLLPPHQPLPPWISPNLAGNLGAYDLGDSFQLVRTPGLTPRGVNYSIRREFLETVGGFDPHLGRVGTCLLSNEELHLTEQALKTGWQVAYLPDAVVAHQVAPERLCRSWFLRRSWWQGISECYREHLAGQHGWRQLGQGGERLLRGLYQAVKSVRDPARRFDHLVYAYGQLGYLGAVVRGLLVEPSASRSNAK